MLLSFLLFSSYGVIGIHAEDIDDNYIAHESIKALNLTMSQKYEDSIPIYEQLIAALQKKNSSPEIIAIWLKGLATCKLNIGKTGEAERLYLNALKSLSSPQYDNVEIVRHLYDALSVVYTQTKNYEKASILNDKAKILYEKNLDLGDGYVQCLSNAALIQAKKGYKTLAKMYIDIALRQAKKNLKDTLLFDDIIYSIAETSGNASLSNNSYISLRMLPYISILNNASMIYLQLGYYSDAIKTLKEAIIKVEEYNLTEPLPYNNLGYIYLCRSKFSKAAEWFQKSYKLCKVPSEIVETGMNAALALFCLVDSSATKFCIECSNRMRSNIQEMFSFMSGEERAIYWKHFEYFLPLLNLILYERGTFSDFGTIYDNILETKGLLLRSTNAIRDAVMGADNENDKRDYIRIQQLRQQLQTERKEDVISELTKKIEEIDKRLSEHVNSYADFAASKSIKWENVRDALSADDVAIEFYNIPLVWGVDSFHTMDGEPRYCAITLRKGYEYPHIIPLFMEKTLDNIEQEDFYVTDSIYRLIWNPLEEELRGVNNIYFAADRELHKIGIEYAPMPDGGIVGDKYNLYRLSSTRVLAENRYEKGADNAVLYGGLRYDIGKEELIAESRSGDYHPSAASRTFTANDSRYGVKYLPGTLKEVEAISQKFSNKPRLVTDKSGTEESFKSLAGSQIDIIHLATHGFFWSEEDAKRRNYATFLNPSNRLKRSEEDKALLRSGLLFSGANIGLKGETLPDDVEDGILTALELSDMNLGNVDMVVMSACESGLGETFGEGVFGLQRGFKLAGANSLLMSLWKVDDTATQLLMTDFYRYYLSGKSKQESLKLAQQTLRNNQVYSDPKYWAGFIMLDGYKAK